MKRRLFTILAALSLLLCVAVGALWVRGHFASDVVSYYQAEKLRALSAVAGRDGLAVWITHYNMPVPDPTEFTWNRGRPVDYFQGYNAKFSRVGTKWRFGGFGLITDHQVGGSFPLTTRSSATFIPYWAMLGATALMPLLWLRSHDREKQMAIRRAKQQCLTCGYDLRASPERCPECGAAAETALASSSSSPPAMMSRTRRGRGAW